MIWHIWDRLTRTPCVSDVVLATTQDPKNEDMVRYAAELGMYVHRGQDEDDIADRLSGAAKLTHAVAVVKVNGDCPLVDPEVIGELVVTYAADGVDYVSNKNPQTYPLGLSAEVISAEALSWCHDTLVKPHDREYVADWIRNHSDRFGASSITRETNLSHHNWTVDTPEDYAFVSTIFDALYRSDEVFGLESVLQFLNQPTGRDLSSPRRPRPQTTADQ